MKQIVVGGGCFWCLEAIFNRVLGVVSVESGYAGGFVDSPDYRSVCSDVTGHAEVVNIKFDQNIIALEDILRIFFDSHDPTSLNRQGADVGSQYRSIILYTNDEDVKCIDGIITESQGKQFKPIVTEVKPLETFYQAEPEHRTYYENHQGNGYCQVVIEPKLHRFFTSFSDKVKS